MGQERVWVRRKKLNDDRTKKGAKLEGGMNPSDCKKRRTEAGGGVPVVVLGGQLRDEVRGVQTRVVRDDRRTARPSGGGGVYLTFPRTDTDFVA